jgi:hypothetical protein
MSLEPSLYVDLTIALLRGMLEETLPIAHAAQLLYMAAQPETMAVEHDIIDDVKAELTNWTLDDLDGLRECVVIQVEMKCIDDEHDHPDDERPHNIAQVVRLATRPDWDPQHVHPNRTQLDEVISAVGRRFLPPGVNEEHIILAASPRPVGRHLRDLLMGGNRVEAEVSEFRAELDRLFPSAEEGGNK